MKRTLSLIAAGIAIAFFAALALSQVPASFLRSGLIFGNGTTSAQGTCGTCTYVAPVLSSFSASGTPGTGTTIVQNGSFIDITAPATGVSIEYTQALPATPYTIVMQGTMQLFAINFNSFALTLTDGTSSIQLAVVNLAGANLALPVLYVAEFNGLNGASFNNDPFAYDMMSGFTRVTWKITDDGTTRKWYLSQSDSPVVLIGSSTHTSFLTATQAGFTLQGNQSSVPVSARVLSWSVTAGIS